MNNRQCVTHREYKMILDDLRKETDVLQGGTSIRYEGNRNMKKDFYYVKFRKFENIIVFVGKIHEQYGNGIDIRVTYLDEDLMDMEIRGLGREMRILYK